VPLDATEHPLRKILRRCEFGGSGNHPIDALLERRLHIRH
jgi:hypothetical protein